MKAQIELQKLLITKYEELRAKNSAYSRRAFSRRLGMSPGAMSEIFNGQRQVSFKLAEKIALKLGLDPIERTELFSQFSKDPIAAKEVNSQKNSLPQQYLQITADQFHIIGNWYHFAILALLKTTHFKSNTLWIAQRLGVIPGLINLAIERLLRLKLISTDEQGNFIPEKGIFHTTDDIANVSIKKAHRQYLEKAQDSLEQQDVHERDFTSLMMPLDPENLPKVKEMIRKFQSDLNMAFSDKPQSEVYQLCIQFFPLTKKINKNGDLK